MQHTLIKACFDCYVIGLLLFDVKQLQLEKATEMPIFRVKTCTFSDSEIQKQSQSVSSILCDGFRFYLVVLEGNKHAMIE